MKKKLQILSLALLAFGLGILNACEPTNKKTTSIIAHAIEKPVRPSKNTVKIALLLDTSNSMDGLINQAKSQLWDIVNKFTYAKCGTGRPNLEIALYQYGNDNLSSQENYIQQVIGFSNDLDEISEKLFSLTTNGGEEYCGAVINTSLKQLDWGNNADDLKMIFIAGNEPFTQGKIDFRDASAQAKEKDVVVNTIFCGNYELGINTQWKQGALLTQGEYMAIDHNRQVVHIDTPYDDVIIKLSGKLNGTYISYGSQGLAKSEAQARQDTNAYEMEEAIAVKRAVAKSSRIYTNSSWDLVDAVEKDAVKLSDIDDSALPKELQGKSETKIKEYVAEKSAERKKIQTEINALNAKRDQYIAEHQKEERGELENAMLKAIEKQAARKNYAWE